MKKIAYYLVLSLSLGFCANLELHSLEADGVRIVDKAEKFTNEYLLLMRDDVYDTNTTREMTSEYISLHKVAPKIEVNATKTQDSNASFNVDEVKIQIKDKK